MAALVWDKTGERKYETGVDRGVLFVMKADGTGYDSGVAWNGLTGVTESPSGAEASAQYADNIKYLTLTSAEEFGATIEAFTYPPEFAPCDGQATPAEGVTVVSRLVASSVSRIEPRSATTPLASITATNCT